MTLEERLKQLPARLDLAQNASDGLLDFLLRCCSGVLSILREDLEENESFAAVTLAALDEVADALPSNMDDVREGDKYRAQEANRCSHQK